MRITSLPRRRGVGYAGFGMALLLLSAGCSSPRKMFEGPPQLNAQALRFSPPPDKAAIYIYVPPDRSLLSDQLFSCSILFDPLVTLQGNLVALPKGSDMAADYHSFYHDSLVSSGNYLYGLIEPGSHTLWEVSPVSAGDGAYAAFYASVPFTAEAGRCYFLQAAGNPHVDLGVSLAPYNVTLRFVGEPEGRQAIAASKLMANWDNWFQRRMSKKLDTAGND